MAHCVNWLEGWTFLIAHSITVTVPFSMQGRSCKIWRQRVRICKTVAACSQYDNLESVAREIKLKGHVAVRCDEHLKASFFGFR
jgi:hypothetical protein